MADAAEIEQHPVRPLRVGKRVDALGIDTGAFAELFARAHDVAERHGRFEVGRALGDQLLQDGLGLVAAFERIEAERALDLGVAMHRRRCRHPLVGPDRDFGFLHVLEQIGERDQRHRVARRQIDCELQIDEAKLLGAPPREDRAQVIKRFRGARLRRIDHQRQPLAGIDVADRLGDQRMARQLFVERLEDLERLFLAALARQMGAIGLHHAQLVGGNLIGSLIAAGGVLALAGEVDDEAGVQFLEYAVPLRTGELLQTVDRGLALVRGRLRPRRQ